MRTVNVGIIGCGDISRIYLTNLGNLYRNVQVVAVADMNLDAAKKRAEEFGIPRVCASNEELLAMEDVEIVLILTNPASHSMLMKAALNAGKNAYCEKPLALNLEEAKEVVALAKEKGLLAGCAPDTILGSGTQTSRKLIDDGWIGRPVGVKYDSSYYGPETWHPNPAFLYHIGAGPMLDIGPYYISCLAYLLGPVKRVASLAKITSKQRVITSQPQYGKMIDVEVPTYVSGILEFENGVVGSLTMTFDGDSKNSLDIELIGTEGTIIVPNPDTFGGENGTIQFKRVNRHPEGELDTTPWTGIPNMTCYNENSRGLGVADMASAIVNGRPNRCNAEFGLHVLEVMLALSEPKDGTFTEIQSRFTPTPAMPIDLNLGDID